VSTLVHEIDDAMDRLGRAFAGAYGLGRPPGQTNDEAIAEYLAARAALRALVA
jgi:hypothetical protein